jgi:hypothetical protein
MERVDAAPSLWRPLGEMLVERGLLTPEELDEVLALQKESGRKLGEIIVDRGYISGPTLALTLAEQWGVELTADEGFGTGLRNEIQKRHEGERKRRPDLHAVQEPKLKGHEIFTPESNDTLAEVNAQLAEDDARIVELETRVLQHAEDQAQHEARIAELVAQETTRIEKALMDETAKLGERFALTQKDLLAAAADWRAKHEAQIVKLLADKLGRLEAKLKEERPIALGADDRKELEGSISAIVAKELDEARKQLVVVTEKQRAEKDSRLEKLLGEKFAAFETRFRRPAEDARVEKLLGEKFAAVEARFAETPRAAIDAEELRKLEQRIAELVTKKLADSDARVERLLAEKFAGLDTRFAEMPSVTLDAEERRKLEQRIAELVTKKLADGEARVGRLLGEKFAELDARFAETPSVKLDAEERRNLEQRIAELVADAVANMQTVPEVDLSGSEKRIKEFVAREVTRMEETLTSQAENVDEKLVAANDGLTAKVNELQTALQALAKERKREHLDRLAADVRSTVDRLERLEELVRTSTHELFERLEPPARVGPETTAEEEQEIGDDLPAFTEHLVFAPAESGYSLITVELPPPEIGAELALGDEGERFVVTKVASSPFPRDERPCAYVQRVS